MIRMLTSSTLTVFKLRAKLPPPILANERQRFTAFSQTMSLRIKSDLSLAVVHSNDLTQMHTILILSKTQQSNRQLLEVVKKWLDFVTYAYYQEYFKKYFIKSQTIYRDKYCWREKRVMCLFQAVVFLSGKAGFDLLKHSVYITCVLLLNSSTCCVAFYFYHHQITRKISSDTQIVWDRFHKMFRYMSKDTLSKKLRYDGCFLFF